MDCYISCMPVCGYSIWTLIVFSFLFHRNHTTLFVTANSIIVQIIHNVSYYLLFLDINRNPFSKNLLTSSIFCSILPICAYTDIVFHPCFLVFQCVFCLCLSNCNLYRIFEVRICTNFYLITMNFFHFFPF